MISLSFRCGVKVVNTCEVRQYNKFTCSTSHMEGCLEKIVREYGLQTDKGEIEHSVNDKSNFADLRHIWEPYLKLDVFCLAFIYARYSMERQNMSVLVLKTV